ncbi:MAG: hypothetical protein Kow0029_22200 [Candidatus Rifleibacteriota bacterium]
MNCICCNAQTRNIDIKDEFFNNPLQQCRSCGHIQLLKVPNETELKSYYEGSYSENRQSFIGESYFRIMQKRAAAQKAFIDKHLSLPKGSEIHDIGCGYGFLMELFQQNHPVKGFEYDPDAIAFCKSKNLNVVYQADNELKPVFKKNSTALLSHVLEHFIDPKQEMKKLLSSYNYLFAEIPSYGRADLPTLKEKEGHVNFFCRKSLEEFLKGLNCKILALESCGPDKLFFTSPLLKLPRRILHKFCQDYFFNQYERTHKNDRGIWLRCLLESKVEQ